MGTKSWLAAVLAVCFAAGCGDSNTNTNPPADTGVAADTGTTTDTGRPGDTGTTPTDGGAGSRAGLACTSSDNCNGLECVTAFPGGMCIGECENNASQTNERGQCGGTGSTCLEPDPEATATERQPFCTRACTSTARTEATGACRDGYACTFFWWTHVDSTGNLINENPGCDFYCNTDSQCPRSEDGGMMYCYPRRQGRCGTTPPDNTLRADGEPCNPMEIQTSGRAQCRGLCFGTSSTNRTQGICGSFINTRVATACPDDPVNFRPLAPSGDGVAICIYKNCTTNADCTAPLRCFTPEGATSSTCGYTTGPGIPGDGGTTTDAATDTGTPPADTGTPPVDSGTAPVDSGTPATDSGTAPMDAATGTG